MHWPHVWVVVLMPVLAIGCGAAAEGDRVFFPEQSPTFCETASPPQGDFSVDARCEGAVPGGDADEENARLILGRFLHEVAHLAEAAEDPESNQVRDGALIDATDSGFVAAHIEELEQKHCVTVRFECWTGGHGGFGPSALEGFATIELVPGEDGLLFRSEGQLGLVEGGALSGAPQSEVVVSGVIERGALNATAHSSQVGTHVLASPEP